MNYEHYITNTYNITLSSISKGLLLLNNDGTLTLYSYDLPTNTYANFCNFFAQKSVTDSHNAWGYLYVEGGNCSLVVTNSVDFVKLENTSQETIDVHCDELYNNGNNTATDLGGGDEYNLYGGVYSYYFDELDTISTYGTNYFGYLSYHALTYFDFSSCWCPEDTYYYDYQVKQFTYDGNSFYFYQQHLGFAKKNSVSISYGSFTSRVDVAYTSYLNGYNDGYEDGYYVGSSVDRNTANAFAYIEETFNAIGGIMRLEVIPHVTIGLCFSIPFIIVIITLIFKMVKK